MSVIPDTLKEFAVPIGSVRRLPDDENPRIGDVPAMKESLRENTQYRPAVVNIREGTRYGDRTVLAGNHTHQALEELGEPEIAVTYVDVDDEAAWKIVLRDNRQGDLGTYDPELLLAAVARAGGIAGTGYDEDFLAGLMGDDPKEGLTDPDEVPEPPKEPVTRVGDVWLLGQHRLVCGDSADGSVVAAALGDHPEVDFLFTSPPYNVNMGYGVHDDAEVPWSDYRGFLHGVLAAWLPRLADGRMIGWNIGSSPKTHPFKQALLLEELGLDHFRTIVWEKPGVGVPLWQNTENDPSARNFTPTYKHEFVLLYSKGRVVRGARVELDCEMMHDVVVVSPSSGTRDLPEDGGPRTTHAGLARRANKAHPATFPVRLPELFARRLCDRRKVMADPFAGAGSSLLAAERSGRVGVGSELDPAYVDLACARFQRHTGIVPILEATGEPHDFAHGDGTA